MTPGLTAGEPRRQIRHATRAAFFLLFVLAPPLDLFRFDLTLGHFVVFGQPWELGFDAMIAGEVDAGRAAVNLILLGFLPLALLAAGFIAFAWRYGRLYCGWLCPHFSVVELINGLMRRASGKPTLWERRALPEMLPSGRRITPKRRFWLPTLLAAVSLAFLWAVSLLTYLLPPERVWGHLMDAALTRNEALFIGVGTVVFALEFLFARHLFCRFGCAVGLFQSLAWMANRRAMVVGFERHRAGDCIGCDSACDNACPMRLRPRAVKRRIFTCTQCSACISACEQVQVGNRDGSLLQWVDGTRALNESEPRTRTNPERTGVTRPSPSQPPRRTGRWKSMSENSGTA